MDPDAIDRVLRKHAAAIWLTGRYSVHSMRPTFYHHGTGELRDSRRSAGLGRTFRARHHKAVR